MDDGALLVIEEQELVKKTVRFIKTGENACEKCYFHDHGHCPWDCDDGYYVEHNPSNWHVFNDWSDAPDCEGVLVTVENKFGQRFVTEAWWSVGVDCKCNWYVIDGRYAENWREGIYILSQNWKVVAWMYRPEPYKED